MKNRLKDYLFWHNFKFCASSIVHHEPTGLHGHDDFYELVFVYKGTATHVCGGVSQKISSGNIFLIPPVRKHAYTDPEDLGIYNILFSRSFMHHFQHDLYSYPNFQFLFGTNPEAVPANTILKLPDSCFPEMLSLLNEIIREEKNIGDFGGQTAVLSNALRIILLISRHAVMENPERKVTGAFRISQIRALLDRKCTEKWTLGRMAETAGMSVANFRLLFKLQTGLPPLAYLQELRLKKASLLLEMSDLSVTEIAQQCGFEDSNYFTRQFRLFSGMSPREFRETQENKN